LIRRKGGSNTQIDGVTYSFNDENDHTADVENEDHIRWFLSVPTYLAAEESEPAPVAEKKARATRAARAKAAE
jgi:hypothetical protein